VVFKDIIANRNGQSSKIAKEAWDMSFLPHGVPVFVVVRYVLADMKAWTWVQAQISQAEEDDKQHDFGYLSWAPYLASLGHPFVQHLDLLPYLKRLSGWNLSKAQAESLQEIIVPALLHVIERSSGFVLPQKLVEIQEELRHIESHSRRHGDYEIMGMVISTIKQYFINPNQMTIALPHMSKIISSRLWRELPFPPQPWIKRSERWSDFW
jgi:hypothetical protein